MDKIVKTVALKANKQKLIEMEAEILSIDTRINDLEWQYEFCFDDGNDNSELLDQRRRAIDKKKHMIKESSQIRTEIMEMSE